MSKRDIAALDRAARALQNPRGKPALIELIRRTAVACRRRGHAMSVIEQDEQAGKAHLRCRQCPGEAWCETSPPPNGIDIHGDAVALNCSIRSANPGGRARAKAKPLSDLARAYLETVLWSSNDDNDRPLDSNYTVDDFAPEAVARAERDVHAFAQKADALVAASPGGKDMKNAVHYFWLTRNRHGSGFWDSPEVWGEDGAEELTKIAKSFGEVDAYVGDDGKVYFS